MKELIIVCNSRTERIAAICLLYGYGYSYDGQTLQEVVPTLTDEDFPHVLLNVSNDKDCIDFATRHYYEERSHCSTVLRWTDTHRIVALIESREAVTIPITKEYDAVVSKDGIQVGCQNIKWRDFDKLVEATKKVRN